MPEAEDVIVDAARHATSYAVDLWRRNRAQDERPRNAIALADVRQRLELLIEAALGVSIPIRAAAVHPPRTILSRVFERGRRSPPRFALPATDGNAIFLPPCIADIASARALDLYRLAALHQALRCVRGSACAFPWLDGLLVQDLFLLSEARAAHARLLALMPGFARAAVWVRNAVLAERPRLESLAPALREIEMLYRNMLASGTLAGSAAVAIDPQDSLAWARLHAREMKAPADYRGLAADLLIGEILKPDAAPLARMGDAQPRPLQPARSVQMKRRPRARRGSEDEDDEETGMWMIQTTQPSEHVEDALGLQRPVDDTPDADLEGAGDSVSDLEELRLVSAPGSPREVLSADDPLPPQRASANAAVPAPGAATAYPEWDYRIVAYRERAAVVHELGAQEGSSKWVADVLERHRATLSRVRRRFEALRSRRSMQHAQPDGDEIDLDAYVAAYGDRRAKLPRDDRLYLVHRPARRDFALLVLIDVSGSTDAWIGGERRIIDLEKEALVIVSTALEALRVRFGILAFSGHGPAEVRVRAVKAFSERFERSLARRVAGLEPEDYTRAGAALRHATAVLMREPAYRRLLLVLSDGKPNDCDRYEGRYGVEDTRQAVAEARLQGIAPFCVTVDRQASSHLAALFGVGNYAIAREPQHLASALLEWLRSVTVAIS